MDDLQKYKEELEKANHYIPIAQRLLEQDIQESDRNFLETAINILERSKSTSERGIELFVEASELEASRCSNETEEERKERLRWDNLSVEEQIKELEYKKSEYQLSIQKIQQMKDVGEAEKEELDRFRRRINLTDLLIKSTTELKEETQDLRIRKAKQEQQELYWYGVFEQTFPNSDQKALEMLAREPLKGIYLLLEFIKKNYDPLDGEYDYLTPKDLNK